MNTEYKSVARNSEGLYKEKGSKFIGRCFPVSDENEVKSCLELLRKEYYDARHHCYAYILNPSGDKTRANDDGEPNHSAGDPILGQIKSYGLTNTLIVVIRYFGGTKLGVGGLIHAYKTAAELAIKENKIVTIPIKRQVLVQFKYEDTSEVMRVLNECNANINSQNYTDSCALEVSVGIGILEVLESKLTLLSDLGHSVHFQFKEE